MINKALSASFIMLVAGVLQSCGKKANESYFEPTPHQGESVEVPQILENHKELQKAILDDDHEKFEDIMATKVQIDLNKVLENGQTLMTMAAQHNRVRMVQLLTENMANVSETNVYGETPLMIAAKEGYTILTKALIILGSDLDTKDKAGNTALHLAVLNGRELTAELLINNGANIDITNNKNQTALKLAETVGLNEIVTFLQSITVSNVTAPDEMAFKNLIQKSGAKCLNPVLTKFPHIVKDYEDLNLLVLIIEAHDHDKALSLTILLMGYDVHVDGPKNAVTTPLIAAIKAGYEDFVDFFLKNNANVNLTDIDGKSPLMWAIEKNNPVMVKSLLEMNASKKYSINKEDKKRVIKACDVLRSNRKKITTIDEKKAYEEIRELLSCPGWSL